MRVIDQVYRAGVAMTVLCLLAGPASAQGFFQTLFGISAPTPSKPVPSLRSFGRFSPYGGAGVSMYDIPAPVSRPDTYRTMCVRMCDGYYFPISSNATRSQFYRDAQACQASCGSEARLFTMPNSSEDMSTMTDLTGRTYGRLPVAFRYRKALNRGCACRPAPWSSAERARHRQYAEEAQLARARSVAEAQARTAGLAALVAKALAPAQPAGRPIVAAIVASQLSGAGLVAVAQSAGSAQPESGAPLSERVESGDSAGVYEVSDTLGSEQSPPPRAQKAIARGKRASRSGARAGKPGKAGVAGWYAASKPKYSWSGEAPARYR